MTPSNRASNDNEITLRDVINHISSLKSTFTIRFDNLDRKVEENRVAIDKNRVAIKENRVAIERNRAAIQENRSFILENGTRISAFDEDLVAVIKDSFKIRRHVGMPIKEC